MLDVLHPGTKHTQLDAVLDLARHRAGVTPDAPRLVEDERVLTHVLDSPAQLELETVFSD